MDIQAVVVALKRKIAASALLCGFAVFIGVLLFWQSLIGNPHVAETFFGFGLSTIAGILTFLRLRKWAKPTR